MRVPLPTPDGPVTTRADGLAAAAAPPAPGGRGPGSAAASADDKTPPMGVRVWGEGWVAPAARERRVLTVFFLF